MPVQVIENWAHLKGKIVSIAPHSELGDYITATVAVNEATPVEGYPNLFSWAPGKEITVNIPTAKTGELSLSSGDEITARVRKAGPASAFVDPDSVVKSG